MAKSKKRDNSAEPATSNEASATPDFHRWSPPARAIVSFLILFHLTAVVLAPLSMMLPSASLIEPIRRKFEPYHQATYLGHGYQFFAPDPGPSHFVEYEATGPDGNIIKGRFPDRDLHWPRLHYHRWFMLSERVYDLNRRLMSDKAFAEMIANMNRDIETARRRGEQRVVRNLERDQKAARETHLLIKQQSERLNAAIENEIKRIHNATDIKLTCVERSLPDPREIADDKRKLDDEIYLPEDRKIPLTIKVSPANAEEIR